MLVMEISKEKFINPLKVCYQIETSQLICRANRLTGFYIMATFGFNSLRKSTVKISRLSSSLCSCYCVYDEVNVLVNFM